MLKSVVSALAAAVCCSAHAMPVLDQNFDSFAFGATPIMRIGDSGPITFAQGFQQSMGNISGAGVVLMGGYDSLSVTLSLYDALPNNGGSALASGSAISSGGWLDVFWPLVATSPDTAYYLVIGFDQDSVVFWGRQYDGYALGQAYSGNDGFLPMPGIDFLFRTYADVPVTTDIPEPASLALVGLGLGLMATRRRGKVHASIV